MFLRKFLLFAIIIVIYTIPIALAGCASPQVQAQVQSGKSPESATLVKPAQHAQVKNIILFIGDGMSLENERALSLYLYGNPTGLIWHDWPYRTWVSTWDIDSYNRHARKAGASRYSPGFDPKIGYDPERGGVAPWPIDENGDRKYFLTALPTFDGGSGTYAIPATDSASAATAIATGMKTNEGNISWAAGDPADGRLETIAELMRAKNGSAIGIVSTVEFDHATPAAFVAHSTSRGNVGKISHEIITETKPEVVIGSGHPDWISGYISSSDLKSLRNSDEYVLVERVRGENGGENLLKAAERAKEQEKKLFGLFGGSNGCLDPPKAHDSPGNPGFDVEEENPSLAEATDAALEVLSADPDGFLLMVEQGDINWANHYNNYHWMIGSMWDLDSAVKAAVEFVDRPGDSVDSSNTIIIVTSDHCNGYLRLSQTNPPGVGDLPEMNGKKYHYSYPGGEVSYGCTQHTNELVSLYVFGSGYEKFTEYEGSWYPGTEIIDNSQIFRMLCESAGID
ncbi:MAG: alkaline phosphatase [bacterium]